MKNENGPDEVETPAEHSGRMSWQKYEGPFYTVLWRLLRPLTQVQVAELIAKKVGSTPNGVRSQLRDRGWKKRNRPFCIVADGPAGKVYPYLPQILEVAREHLANAEEVESFVRYRFLQDSHALGLYRPFSEGRLALLLTWMYLPAGAGSGNDETRRVCFILAFNNDTQLYRHLTVLVDRMISNRHMEAYLRPVLPRVSILMVLFGDYEMARDLCKHALGRLKHGTSEPDETWIRLELQIIRADAESHIPVPVNLNPCKSLHGCVRHLRAWEQRDGNELTQNKDFAAVLRMAFCAYFRALVRVTMYLRGHGIPYSLPRDTREWIEAYEELARDARAAESQPEANPTSVVGNRICEGSHYLALDGDTLSRVYAVLVPELILLDSPDRPATGGRVRRRSSVPIGVREEIAQALEEAAKWAEEAEPFFAQGDAEDQAILDAFPRPDSIQLEPDQVKATTLSSYRRCSTKTILHWHQATFAKSEVAFKAARDAAIAARSQFESEVGQENLRHARILNERLKSMIDRLKFESRHEWLSALKKIEKGSPFA